MPLRADAMGGGAEAGERSLAGNDAHLASRLLGRDPGYAVGSFQQFAEVDAGRHSHVLESEHQVLARRVAGGAGCERTAAEPACRAIDVAHALAIGLDRIGDAEAVGVVAVIGEADGGAAVAW